MKLTKRLIDQATYRGFGNSRYVLWDEETKGFGLRVYPTGRKVFLLSYRASGRKRMIVLGPYGVLTVDMARKEAIKRLGEVIQGEDPLEKRQRAVNAPTVKSLCHDYVDRHAKPFKKTWKRDLRLLERYIIPEWGGLKASQIKRSDIAALHHKIGKHSIYEANHTYALLSRMFECGRQWGFVEEHVSNPARGIKKFREKKRQRYLTQDELPRLAQAINSERNVFIRSAIWLLLLTGLRKSELLCARWEWVDFEENVLKLPDTKGGRPFVLPLSPEAIRILKDLPKQDGLPYVFQGQIIGRPLVTIQKNWDRIKRAARIEDLRVHDLRRTVGSWIVQKEKDLHLVSKILNHADISTTAKVYAHVAESHVRNALERHSAEIFQLASEQAPRSLSLIK